MERIRQLIRFLTQDLWRIRTKDLPFFSRTWLKIVKVFLLSARSFREDRSEVRASALTLYTLLSLVPVTAMLFGIAKGFGLEGRLEQWLLAQLPEQKQLLSQLIIFARRALETTQGGVVAGTGVAFLLYSVVKVVGNIEQAFNQIWKVAKSRPWNRKFSDYLSIILVGPFFMVGASSMNVYVATLVSKAAEATPIGGILDPFVSLGLRAGPIALLWFLFSFTYIFIPNTKVPVSSAVFGGAIASVAYQVTQSLYIHLQVGVSSANAIYGSFAALPLFLIWLQLSWHIVLIGAELTYQHQNFETNDREERLPDLSFRAIERLALATCELVIARFLKGEAPPGPDEIGKALGIPASIQGDLLLRLVRSRLLSEVTLTEDGEIGYQPARDPHTLPPLAILTALRNLGEDLKPVDGSTEQDKYGALLEDFDRHLDGHPSNRPLGKAGISEGSGL